MKAGDCGRSAASRSWGRLTKADKAGKGRGALYGRKARGIRVRPEQPLQLWICHAIDSQLSFSCNMLLFLMATSLF
jgi:hypothetical protein